MHRIDDGSASAIEVGTLQVHIDEDYLISGTDYVDPLKWDPLLMKFCEFFGQAQNVYPSRLAEGWQLPHRDRLAA